MKERRIWEALWRLGGDAITTEDVAQSLFAAIGAVIPMEPARYDLNQRGQWKSYDRRRFIVDTLTQRTQVVTLAEEREFSQGGSMLMVSTGKHGESPQAIARWWEGWPAESLRVEDLIVGASDAFAEMARMELFLLRVLSDDSGEDPWRVVASADKLRIAQIEKVAGPGRSAGGGARVWTFFPHNGGEPPAGLTKLFQ